MRTPALPCPLALFDELQNLENSKTQNVFSMSDYAIAKSFLMAYKGSYETFKTYRREIERLLQWSWFIAGKDIKSLKRADIEAFINFCLKPLKSWMGVKRAARFVLKNGQRVQNPEWRPFVVSVSKVEHKKGKTLDKKNYQLSNDSKKSIFAVLSTFFNFLIAEGYTELNPILQIRQKNRFIQNSQSKRQIRRLSTIQWEYILKSAEEMATKHPDLHERTLFIMSALYAMYLRISEVVASKRWTPKMGDFFRDNEGGWWFVTVGKGNKERHIAVSDAMLKALKRWREFLNLSPTPSPGDSSPLIPKKLGAGPVTSTGYIRRILQQCFDVAAEKLKQAGLKDEAETLLSATVHWLRHTGISEDVKRRPREHVRDDAGHSSGATTDRYVDVELRARNKSAKRKPISIK